MRVSAAGRVSLALCIGLVVQIVAGGSVSAEGWQPSTGVGAAAASLIAQLRTEADAERRLALFRAFFGLAEGAQRSPDPEESLSGIRYSSVLEPAVRDAASLIASTEACRSVLAEMLFREADGTGFDGLVSGELVQARNIVALLCGHRKLAALPRNLASVWKFYQRFDRRLEELERLPGTAARQAYLKAWGRSLTAAKAATGPEAFDNYLQMHLSATLAYFRAADIEHLGPDSCGLGWHRAAAVHRLQETLSGPYDRPALARFARMMDIIGCAPPPWAKGGE